MKCQDCGKEREDVKETTCPYAEELYDEIQKITVCDDCYNERGYSI